MQRGEVGEVLHRGELVVEHRRVAHVGDAAALLLRGGAKDGDGAAGRSDEACDDAEQRGFACAVFAQNDSAGAGCEAGGDIAKRGETPVDFGNAAEGNAGLGEGSLRDVCASCGFGLRHRSSYPQCSAAALSESREVRLPSRLSLLQAWRGHTLKRTWPVAEWHGRRRQFRRCLQREPGSRL